MSFNDLMGAKVKNLLPAATYGASAVNYSSDKNLGLVRGVASFVLDAAGDSGTGTNPTCTVKIQSGTPALGGSYTTAGANAIVLRNDTDDNIKLAATWTQDGAASIKYVDLLLKRVGTIAGTDTITLEIDSDSSGDPDDTALGTAVAVVPSTIGTNYQWVRFTFTTPVNVADSTAYWLVLSGAYDVSTENHICWQTTTVGSAGNANVYDTGWTAVSTNSRLFNIYDIVFADVTGGGFTANTTAATQQILNLNTDLMGQHLRGVLTIGGTDTPAYVASLNMVYLEQYR